MVSVTIFATTGGGTSRPSIRRFGRSSEAGMHVKSFFFITDSIQAVLGRQ